MQGQTTARLNEMTKFSFTFVQKTDRNRYSNFSPMVYHHNY